MTGVVVICDVVLAVTFYVLLREVSRPLAGLVAGLRLMHSAITGVNLITLSLVGSFAGTAERDAFALLFLESHDYFFATGLVFFGLHVLVLGCLTPRTRASGVLLAVAAVCYLVAGYAVVTALDPGAALVLVPAALLELSLCVLMFSDKKDLGARLPLWRQRGSKIARS